MTLELDMKNPRVREMLGADDPRLTQPGTKKREMAQIAGDQLDPTGRTNLRGLARTTRLDGGKHETLVLFRGKTADFVLTVDVYAIPGEPLQVHYICPRCHKQGRITQDAKQMAWAPTENRVLDLPDGQKTRTNGVLSVEPFQCTWEVGSETHTPGIRAGGLTLCGQKLVIDDNIAREA